MSSSTSRGHAKKRTRLQDATEKRRAEELLEEETEMKRQKKMFAPRKLIGPRDILVNSNLPKIKLEENVGCSSIVKREPLEAESTPTVPNEGIPKINVPSINLEVDKSLAVKVEGLDLEESMSTENEATEHNENVVNETNVEHTQTSFEIKEQSADNQFLQDHITELKALIDQKEQEINVLIMVVNGLQHQLNALDNMSNDTELENEHFVLIDSNINKGKVIQGATSDNAQVVANLSSELMEKHAKIRILSMKMLTLQDKIFGTASSTLELSKNYQTSRDFIQESFKLVLPFLYPYLQLNDILTCRSVCRSWRDATDMLLDPSKMPYDEETRAEEKQKLERGRMPIWKISPLQKLFKAYRFSNMGALNSVTDDHKGTIVGSTVCFDNLILTNGFNKRTASSFFKTFNAHIKYLVIRQCVELPDFKIQILMDRVKLCLSKLPNLQHFKLLFCIDNDKLERENGWDALQAIGSKMYPNTWQAKSFPKLEKLESLELDIENWEGRSEHTNFLQNFSKSLVQPYSEQLKQLTLFTSGLDPSDCLIFPNLVQLSIPRRTLNSIEFKCQHVEKCTITSCRSEVMSYVFHEIQKLFPKLTCLGFKFKYLGEEFRHFFPILCSAPSDYKPSPLPTFSNVLTLELENCGAITFAILVCFPSLQYIKLVNKYTPKEMEDFEDPVLEITKLWKGVNLYESEEFWQHFPNISLVTLEYSGEPMTNIQPKLYGWTREGYANYSCNNFLEEILQM